MRLVKFLAIALLLVNCAGNYSIDETCVKVVGTEQNPYMEGSCRQLIIIDKKQIIITQTDLFCDGDWGCKSYLFDTDGTYTLIDCNGKWLGIDKRTGEITDLGKHWGQKLPANYVGTFIKHLGAAEYTLIKETPVGVKQVYQYKDTPQNNVFTN